MKSIHRFVTLALCSVLILLCSVVSLSQEKASQSPLAQAEAPKTAALSGTPEQTVLARARAYYKAVLEQDHATAATFATPDTRESMRYMTYADMITARVQSAKVADDGTATVVVTKRMRNPMAGYIDFDMQDTWKQIDGQWYMVLPDPKKIVTPFGVLDRPDPKTIQSDSANAIPDPPKVDMDPDQLYKAMNKADKLAQQKAAAQAAAAGGNSTAATPSTSDQTQQGSSTTPPAKPPKSKKKPAKPATQSDKPPVAASQN